MTKWLVVLLEAPSSVSKTSTYVRGKPRRSIRSLSNISEKEYKLISRKFLTFFLVTTSIARILFLSGLIKQDGKAQ